MHVCSELCSAAFSFPVFQVIRIKLHQKKRQTWKFSSLIYGTAVILSLKICLTGMIISVFTNLFFIYTNFSLFLKPIYKAHFSISIKLI